MENLNLIKIIDKKSMGIELNKDEILFVIKNFMKRKMTDYQMASLLMAIKIKGMTDKEILFYTDALLESGEVIDPKEIWVDKHSTGGIGDKVSLVIGPMIASMGGKIGKLSGRGLGFTGGTLDKLESIPGFNIKLTKEQFVEYVNEIGVGLISPLDTLVPADKKIYALRDVTATTDSMPLIAASIMSKKIASGAKYILIDLKIGNAALTKTLEEAKNLAKMMKKIGKHYKREVFILFSSMEQPLGYAIGNGIEVVEAKQTLKNNGPEDLKEICLKISAELYSKYKNIDLDKAYSLANEVLNNGKAYEKFIEWMEKQGAKKDSIEEVKYFQPIYKTIIKSPKDGFVKILNPQGFGWLSIDLGAGRKNKTDVIDYNVGFLLKAKTGDKVNKYDTLIEIFSNNELTDDFLNLVANQFEISNASIKKPKVILGEIKW